jgi:hypothetical protein
MTVADIETKAAPIKVYKVGERWITYCRHCRNTVSTVRFHPVAISNGNAHRSVHHPAARRQP